MSSEVDDCKQANLSVSMGVADKYGAIAPDGFAIRTSVRTVRIE